MYSEYLWNEKQINKKFFIPCVKEILKKSIIQPCQNYNLSEIFPNILLYILLCFSFILENDTFFLLVCMVGSFLYFHLVKNE